MIDKQRLEAKCSTWNIALTGTQLDQLDAFAQILVDYNQKVNLTAITDPEGIEDKHFLDSLLFASQPEVAGRMVDVGAKAVTRRVAIAEGVVEVNEHTMDLLKKRALPKGDVLTCAKIAAILAAKRTSDIIPMCHPLALSLVDVTFRLDGCRIFVNCETHTDGKTGVEMEAIIGVQAACATIYDMCKAVQRDIVIRRVRLLYKDGGRSGVFRAPDMPLD